MDRSCLSRLRRRVETFYLGVVSPGDARIIGGVPNAMNISDQLLAIQTIRIALVKIDAIGHPL